MMRAGFSGSARNAIMLRGDAPHRPHQQIMQREEHQHRGDAGDHQRQQQDVDREASASPCAAAPRRERFREIRRAIGAGPTTRITSPGWSISSVSNASMMARHHGTSRMSMSCSICDGTSAAASRRRCVPIFIATARAPMLVEDLLGETFRHHAARRGIEHQRGGMRGGQPIVEPVEPEIGDRRHVNQNFRHHHEQDGEEQQLAGQADARTRARRRGRRRRVAMSRRLGVRFQSIVSTENSQPGDDAPHPGAASNWA